ncbi:MAG: hypothetical protein JKX71_07370 [Amylibacter sp.]|nr:hypothetical protein [Amylibacter sp.]
MDVKEANRAEHARMLDAMILGVMVSRAAAEGVDGDDFDAFKKRHLLTIKEASKAHPMPIDERLSKAKAKYRFS